MDLTGGVFAGGQTYVALSRCTSLEGLVLKSKVTPHDIFVRKEIVLFSQIFNSKELIEKSLRESEAELLYARAAHDFNRGNMKDAVESFALAIGKRNEMDKPLVQLPASFQTSAYEYATPGNQKTKRRTLRAT